MKLTEFAEKNPGVIDIETMGFVSHQFSLADLVELSGVSKTTILGLVNSGVMTPKQVKSGAVSKKYYDWQDVLYLALKYKRFKLPKRRIKIFCNQKGGVGKTSLSTQFAMYCALIGLRVLFIDIDPQWNASLALGINGKEGSYPTLYDLLNGVANLDDVAIEMTPNLFVIPSRQGLNKAEKHLNHKSNSQMQLKMYLDTIKHDFDLIVGDTNPALTMLSINAFVAADEIDIVSETETFSVSGMNGMFETLDELAVEYRYLPYNPAVRIIPNIFDIREAACHDSLVTLKQHYEDFVTTAVVRKAIDFKECQNKAQAVFLNKKKSNATQDIEFLAKELLQDENLVLLMESGPEAVSAHDEAIERAQHV